MLERAALSISMLAFLGCGTMRGGASLVAGRNHLPEDIDACVVRADDIEDPSGRDSGLSVCLEMAEQLVADKDSAAARASLVSATSARWWGNEKHVPRLRRAYQRHLARWIDDAASLDDEAAARVFDATFEVVSYTRDPSHALGLERVFGVLENRGSPSGRTVRRMQAAWLLVRRFERARSLASRFPGAGLESVPDISTDTGYNHRGRGVFKLSDDGRSLRVMELPQDSGAFVIVVAHPECRFTLDAVRAIEKSKYADIMAANAQFVIPQGSVSVELLSAWRAAHPTMPMSYVERESDWPKGIQWAATPAFYFFRNGRVVSEIVGWDSPARLDELSRGLATIGLGAGR